MSDPCPDCGGPTIQVGTWSPPRFGPFCEACHPPPQVFLPGDDRSGWDLSRPAFLVPEPSTPPTEPPSWAGWQEGHYLTDEPPAAFVPPKPFDLDGLARLAEVASARPRVDRAVIAPDVKDWLLANVAIKPAERLGPDHLWGIPVVIDEDMEPGEWELRNGDEVVRGSGGRS